MKVEDFLGIVKEGLQLDDLKQADNVVRVVVGAIKAVVPVEQSDAIADALPEGLVEGWEDVAPLPEDILERADFYLEEGEPLPEHESTPSITQG